MGLVEIGPGSEVLGCWFYGWASADFLAACYVDHGIAYLRSRVRVHVDAKSFGSDDIKLPRAFRMSCASQAEKDEAKRAGVAWAARARDLFGEPELVDVFLPAAGGGTYQAFSDWILSRSWSYTASTARAN